MHDERMLAIFWPLPVGFGGATSANLLIAKLTNSCLSRSIVRQEHFVLLRHLIQQLSLDRPHGRASPRAR